MDKLITFAIPSYNSAEFMHNCINSLVGAGEEIEIIIVNDGSKDDTGKVADSFAEKYPTIVRAVHKENGGHGSGVNKGLELARGKYYKVVDSDDRLDSRELEKLLACLREDDKNNAGIDMYICNYVYVRIDTGERRPMSYSTRFPKDRIFTWDDVKPLGPTQYLMMHSVVYRTEMLREHNISLPHNTFYVDNLYMYEPFPYVEKMRYIDLDLYLYYVGSEEQSVNEKNVIKRIDQQILVTKMVIDCHDLEEIKKKSRHLYRYMLHELSILMAISTIFLYVKGDSESIEKAKELWKYLKEHDASAYKKLRFSSIDMFVNLPGAPGRAISVACYRFIHKTMKVN